MSLLERTDSEITPEEVSLYQDISSRMADQLRLARFLDKHESDLLNEGKILLLAAPYLAFVRPNLARKSEGNTIGQDTCLGEDFARTSASSRKN